MKTTAAAAAAAAILGTSLMAPFHSFKSLGTAAHCGGGLRRQAGCAWACLALCIEMGFTQTFLWMHHSN